MYLELRDNLPFVTLTITYGGNSVDIPFVLVDTGSVSTILAADQVASIGINPDPQDRLYTIRGVGGNDVVFVRRVDTIQVGDSRLPNFDIEVGGMDYGFEINGILGMDFLTMAGALINLRAMSIGFI